MCTPGCSEQGFGYVMSPREQSAREYLQTASNILTEEELHKKALDSFILQAEFFVSVWPLLGASVKWDVVSPQKTLVLFSASLKVVHANSTSVSEAFNAIPKFIITLNYSVCKLSVILSLKNYRIGSDKNNKKK